MCRSKQIFCGAKNFCPNFPKLSRKVVLWILPKNFLSQRLRPFLVWPPERYSFVLLQMLGDIFEVKQRRGPFFPRYSGILPRYFRILPRFSGISPKFSGIFPGLLTNQNFCGCACTSYTTVPGQSVWDVCLYAYVSSSTFSFWGGECASFRNNLF